MQRPCFIIGIVRRRRQHPDPYRTHLPPKEEDASQHQLCNVPQQQPLCGVRLWASLQHNRLLSRKLTGHDSSHTTTADTITVV